jgi:hypothetical protein
MKQAWYSRSLPGCVIVLSVLKEKSYESVNTEFLLRLLQHTQINTQGNSGADCLSLRMTRQYSPASQEALDGYGRKEERGTHSYRAVKSSQGDLIGPSVVSYFNAYNVSAQDLWENVLLFAFLYALGWAKPMRQHNHQYVKTTKMPTPRALFNFRRAA